MTLLAIATRVEEQADLAALRAEINADLTAALAKLRALFDADLASGLLPIGVQLNAVQKQQTTSLAAIAALTRQNAAILGVLGGLVADVTGILSILAADTRAVSVRLIVPTHRDLKTGKIVNMATNILDDVASLVPVEFDNLGGVAVPTPTVGSETITNDNTAAVVATVEADAAGTGLNLVMTPVQPPQDGATANVSVAFVVGSGTITTPSVAFTITADIGAENAHLRTDSITTRPLPPAGP